VARYRRVVIVGVGLIGGSVALALRARALAERIVGVGRDKASLQQALAAGIVDEAATSAQAAAEADLACICTPVERIAEQVGLLLASGTEAWITDAGSVKAPIVRAVEERWPHRRLFVGSHPLAGSEKRGVQHARADLFEGRVTIVTPTEHTPAALVQEATRFWQALGAHVRYASPEEHDRIVALTSHVPHGVAAALARILPEHYRSYCAGGWRDTTRIAAGDASLWAGILLMNRHNVLEALDAFDESLRAFRQALQRDDLPAVVQWLEEGRQSREALGS